MAIEVLLVEDNVGDVLLICQALTAEPFPVHVHVGVDGEQALHFVEERHLDPDLIILDLNIPKVSGLSFLARCKKQAPIVVFSSSTAQDDVRRAVARGAKEFVRKSSDLREYAQQVSQIVRNWASTGAGRNPVA